MEEEEREVILSRINRLAEERLRLYAKASRATATGSERKRMAEISREMDALWDQLRRERAARRARPLAPPTRLTLEREAVLNL